MNTLFSIQKPISRWSENTKEKRKPSDSSNKKQGKGIQRKTNLEGPRLRSIYLLIFYNI